MESEIWQISEEIMLPVNNASYKTEVAKSYGDIAPFFYGDIYNVDRGGVCWTWHEI